MGVNGQTPSLPKPLTADYPDDGVMVADYAVEEPYFRLTAHDAGVFRVWRAGPPAEDWAYYPIQVVGMTQEEIERAINLACRLLEAPTNRKARRAAGAH